MEAWRQSQRRRLLEARARMPAAVRRQASEQMAQHLATLCRIHGWALPSSVMGAWWPIRREPDLRPWLAALVAQGVHVALPAVVQQDAPLHFRRWTPQVAMEGGFGAIPQPADPALLQPQLILAPAVGFDRAGYRLGYGGGYYDRTLAALRTGGRVCHAVLVGYAAAELDSIHPEPHDARFDVVVTEQGVFMP